MTDDYKLTIRIEGPAVSKETTYGPCEDRTQLAEATIPVTGDQAWRAYRVGLAVGVDNAWPLIDISAARAQTQGCVFEEGE